MSSPHNANQNAKPALLLAVALLVAGGAAGYVLLGSASDSPDVAQVQPVAPAQRAAPPQAIHAPPPSVEQTGPRPSATSSAEPESKSGKRSRLASDLAREQVWSALGRKHNLKPAAPGSAAPSESAAALLPTLDKDYVRESIKEQLVPVAIDCYNTVLQKDATLGGSLVFNFTIIGDEEIGGVVEAVELGEDSTFDDEFLRECLSESLMTVTFPPPQNGGRVEVSYPMYFEPE